MKQGNIRTSTAIVLLVGGVVAGSGLFSPGATAGPGEPGYIRRFAANFTTFGTPPEIFTNVPPLAGAQGGTVVYDKDFFTANDINTLYVTVSAVGDTHQGAKGLLSCLLDDVACNPGANPVASAPSGWVTVIRHKNYNDGDYTLGATPYFGDGGGGAGDVHDNIITYTWCTPIRGAGTHNVKVKMASLADTADGNTQPGAVFFMEGVHFFIDGSRVADPTGACTPVPGPTVTDSGGSDALKQAHSHATVDVGS